MLTINNTLDGYLKDVEIKGNTIQDASNLADIRSVGDKVEGQELYEIPVLSCGKNLFDGELKQGSYDSQGNPISSSYSLCSLNKISVKPNTSYIFSMKSYTSNLYVSEYCNNSFIRQVTVRSNRILQTSPTTNYIRFNTSNNGVSIPDISDIQLEEGTVATPYEPYQEDKLTILSPVQLEKVGDVADRIIEKDGVWGVEKNIIDVAINSSISFNSYGPGTTSEYNGALFNLPILKPISQAPICNKLAGRDNPIYPSIGEGISILNNQYVYVILEKNKGDVRAWCVNNNVWFKCIVNSPQFIPLPHDQQVKLRTFAGKTNISFLTEIEGTIKAQVPKSLGATVNTHTEQIGNLNKELDRVKKLEESTVSTVTTESDFTTVEATSNGYFEDVKLEGKTLVNKILNNHKALRGLEDTEIKYVDYQVQVKPSTEYTVVLSISKNTSSPNSSYSWGAYIDGATQVSRNICRGSTPIISVGGALGVYALKFTTKDSITDSPLMVIGLHRDWGTYEFEADVMLLEGDHTQNPPSYFEGLKSVGQSATTSEDGTDEIVVESVNENLFDGKFSSWWIGHEVVKDDTLKPYSVIAQIEPNYEYYIQSYTNCFDRYAYAFLDSDMDVIYFTGSSCKVDDNTIKTKVAENNTKYLLVYCNSKGTLSSSDKISITKHRANKYIEHQSDKKRLLYYNTETQAWEKPILRQWDSIEKHADGKYYYHQRSGEAVLTGNEFWELRVESDSQNVISFNGSGLTTSSDSLGVVCDKFPTMKAFGEGSDFENIFIATSTRMQVRILKSKLSTQNVAGFKQWLQTNPVTVVYQLAQEKVYECTNIDLITYANETNYIVESGAIVPRTTLKVHNNISNVVSLLQKKVSLLESDLTKYMITQNRLQLSSTYSADSVTFKVDYAVCSENRSQENYNTDLYNLILNNILVGKDNYDYDHMFNIIMDYASWSQISWGQFDILVGIMDLQHNPPIEPPIEEVPCETPEE